MDGTPMEDSQTLRHSILLHLGDKERYSRNSLNWEEFFGSSLELAPSLLNIYDGIASSTTTTANSTENNRLSTSDIRHHSPFPNHHDPTASSSSLSSSTPSPIGRSSVPPTSLSLPRGAPSARSTPTTSPCSPTSPPIMSRVPYRNAKLPSLSEPIDRPVSLMDAETSSKLLHSGTNHCTGDSKKRPLSISSASSASSSSPLPVNRIKRQIVNSLEYGQNDSVCGKSGCRCNSKVSMSPDGESKHRVMCARMVSESHSSMDSGCVENDHSGFRCFDDMSLASSSEAGSIRDDMSSGIQDFVDTSQSSLGLENTDSFQSTQSVHGTRNEYFMGSNTPKAGQDPARGTQQPNNSPEESDIIKRMGSYIVRNSPDIGRASVNSIGDRRSSVDERRRLNSISRNEARKNFFSNYEERYTKMHLPSRKNSEPDYAEIDDATPDNSPVSPTKENPLLAASKDSSNDKFAPNEDLSPLSPDVMIASTVSTTATSPPMSSTSSFSSHSSSKRSSCRSSRRAAKSGDVPSTPSSPVYVTYVQRVVAEIVDSERTYISSLEDIIYGYLEPLEGMLNMEAAKDDIVCLFSNIREIYDFGRIFLTDLELTANDPIKVAECFVRHNEGFVIYTEYCTNYPCAVEVLTRFMQHSELSELCKERQLALGHGLPLGAYLLKPVQRILKYHLLLQNIVKSYEKEGKDVPVLKQAFQHMTKMAHHINEMKRKHEHAVRIQEIQSQLEDYSGEDLTRLGELVLESTFRVYGAKASRQVFLFERGLLISKKKEGGMLSCKTFIKCSNLMLVEVIPNEPLSFHAIPFNNPRAQYTLQARNMEQKRRWCQEMKRLILESFKGRIPDSVKNLVMELGREHDDDYVTKESLDAVRKHQHTAPEYLEKRRVRRKSGTRMPDFSLLKPNKAKRTGQRKEDKAGSRGLLDPGGRRAESKSPDSHRRIFSKLISPQGRSKSHSLPTTPLTENTSITRMLSAANNSLVIPSSEVLFPQQGSDQATTPTPESPSVSDLDIQSPVSPIDKNPSIKSTSSDGGNEPPPVVVKHTLNRQAAVKRQSSKSKSKSPEFRQKDNDDGKENVKPTRCSDDKRGDYSDEENDDYVRIREDHVTNPSPQHKLNLDSDVAGTDVSTCNEQTETRSSSLPSLLDDSMEEVVNESPNNQCQSSDNINHTNANRGRMSRRDIQDAFGGRNNKKHQPREKGDKKTNDVEYLKTLDSDERLAYEKNLVLNKALRIPNTSQYLNIPSNKSEQQKQGEKARLTTWNSMDKLRDGSMTDIAHIHDDPWIINADTPATSNENIVSSTTSLDINSSTPNNVHSHSHPSNLDSNDDMFQNDSLDWLVYLKRNCIAPGNVSFAHKPKRMSTSVLERSASVKEHTRPRRRISDNTNQYSTPPRHLMTHENMQKAGGYHTKDYDNIKTNNSNPELVQHSDYNTFPRKGVKGITPNRPYSLEFENVPDESQLRDESNRIVAEMEDYISNASSTENIKITNKFPTTLPTINVEKTSDDANSSDDKRLSTVSSMSTSSYDSTSSDGLVGTLKSKLNTWALEMAKTNDESEHSYNSPLSSDNDDDIGDDEKTLTSTPKPKNSFEPPLNKKKSLQEERKLESVLREHSLGSESLGSRMAHAGAALTEPCKSMPHLQTVSSPGAEAKHFQNNSHTSDSKGSTDNARFSLPPTKEAAEALSLENCDIRQSDSGFSFQSNDSTLSDVLENLESPSEANQNYETKPIVALKSNVPVAEEKQKSPKLSRHNSTESVDSADSFYERRLSIILNSEEIKESLKIVNVYDDTDQNSTPPTTPIPKRRSIRERVQLIEENTRPSSPKPADVRKREPGAIIRQRLESLNRNMNYGRSKTCDPIPSRTACDHREFTRSKSQPPSHYKYGIRDVPATKPKCSDDISVNCVNSPIHTKGDSYKSRERVNSLSNKPIRGSNLSRSKDSFLLSKSKESLHNSKDNINNYISRSKETINSYSLTLPKPQTPSNKVYHSSTPGHEKDWIGRFVDDNDESSSMNTSNQFVHHAKHDLPHSDEVTAPSSASSATSQEVASDTQSETSSDQQSSEVDNLVIMKGWVQALISKFQDT